MGLWASARNFLKALCRKIPDRLKDIRATLPAIWAFGVFPEFLKNSTGSSKRSLACSCKTPGVGVQACSNEILLNSADAASPPSLLLLTIPPTPCQNCCRLHRGRGSCRCLRLEISAASFATSELRRIRRWEQWGIWPVSQTWHSLAGCMQRNLQHHLAL